MLRSSSPPSPDPVLHPLPMRSSSETPASSDSGASPQWDRGYQTENPLDDESGDDDFFGLRSYVDYIFALVAYDDYE